MIKILSIGASSSSSSINQILANYAARQISNAEVTVFKLDQLSLPIYCEDEEKNKGIPAAAHDFLAAIRSHDRIVISMAEHNGSYTAAFKNLYDWTSRIEQNLWSDKAMLLLSTSPGPRGGATVLAAAEATFPRMGAQVCASMSLPNFYDNYGETGIQSLELKAELKSAISQLCHVSG